MRYGQGLLDEILRRTDLVQLVGRRVKLVRKGRVLWGCCPFHKEKSPSFKVANERRTYKCFGCGAGGDAFKWLTETEGLTFPEAVERLAGEAGVELPKWSPEDEAREEQRKTLYDVVELACQFFQDQLHSQAGSAVRSYAELRGLDQATLQTFRLGYAPDSRSALRDHLAARNIPLDAMVAAGLVRPSEGDRGPRDFFYDRLMFPISDPRGRVIAFGGRGLSPDAKPKYINTGETSLFNKGHLLYNFTKARAAAIKQQSIILAEGYMDVIALSRYGFEAAVAPLGTAFTEDQLHLLWRVAPEPILAFDGDDAGLRAAHRAARMALPHLKPGHSIRFAFLPAGDDPDTFLRGPGPDAMAKLLEAAEPLGEVLWRGETEGKDFSTPERRAGLERALSDITALMQDSKIADYYRRDFDTRIFETFKRRTSARPGREGGFVPQTSKGQGSRGDRGGKGQWKTKPGFAQGPAVSPAVKNSQIGRSGKGAARRMKEQELASLLWQRPDLAALHSEPLASLPLSDPSLDRLRHELLNLAASGGRLETKALETHLVRVGLTELAEHLARRASSEIATVADGETSEGAAIRDAGEEAELEARWLEAAHQLRDMAELTPERSRALERFRSEASEESWRDVQKLLAPRGQQNE